MRLKIRFLLPLISLPLAGGCIRTQTVIVRPGEPIRLLSPVIVPGKSTATEVAQGQWIVNDNSVTLPAGAYVVVLTSAATQPQTKP